jgi:cytochrome c oxidase subunit 6a
MAQALHLVRPRLASSYHATRTQNHWATIFGSAQLLTPCSVAGPLLIIFAANAWTLWNEHWEHEKHRPAPADRPQYDYLNIRNKAYPWGDGDKTLFWNDKVNYKKTGE